MPDIKLKSNDGEVFSVNIEIAKCSTVISKMVESLSLDDDDEEVLVPNVNAAIMRKIIQWATFHRDDLPNDDDTDDISSWDADFSNMDQSNLFDLLVAAKYLDIMGLLDVGCKTVVNMIKDKTAEEIRRTFNIKNDLTPEEEEQIRREDEWTKENERGK